MDDEWKLRQLAVEMARDIKETPEILKALGITQQSFEILKDTRAFRAMYNEALSEWSAAGNTQKRVKLKAAATVEAVLHEFYTDMKDKTEPLSARTELLKTMARIGGLGNPEPITNKGPGQFFKLEIHLDGKRDPIIIEANTDEGSEQDYRLEEESTLVEGEPYDEL